MSATRFIVGPKTAEYLQQLFFEAELEAYKNLNKRKKDIINKNQNNMTTSIILGIISILIGY